MHRAESGSHPNMTFSLCSDTLPSQDQCTTVHGDHQCMKFTRVLLSKVFTGAAFIRMMAHAAKLSNQVNWYHEMPSSHPKSCGWSFWFGQPSTWDCQVWPAPTLIKDTPIFDIFDRDDLPKGKGKGQTSVGVKHFYYTLSFPNKNKMKKKKFFFCHLKTLPD